MTPEVIELLRCLRASIAEFPRVALLSPGPTERALFPQARVLRRDDWDLGQRRRDLRFDLIVACHVFHYASDPGRWFENVGASCRALLIADLIRRKRSAESELGQDGDSMRYAVDAHRPTASRYFELASLGDQLLARHVFAGAPNEYGPALHVLALVRGQLEGPLIHLGGYPTRPCSTEALRGLHAVIDEFESRGVPAYLGIAPALLRPDMTDYLKRLQRVTPALLNDEPAGRLLALFDEPFWRGANRVHERLQSSKLELQRLLEREVSTYLAPSRRIGRLRARALARLGFDLCIGGRRQRSRQIPSLFSDFAGSSRSYPTAPEPEVAGLDLSSEGEQWRSGNGAGLNGLFETLQAQRHASRTRVRELAGRIAAL